MTINSRNKGKVGERELAKILSEMFGVECRRGQQYSGVEGRDVIGLPGVHIECKRVEKLNLRTAMEQAIKDASKDDAPVVCHRQNNQPWLVTVRLEDLDRLCVAITSLHIDRAFKVIGSKISEIEKSE